MSVTPGWHPDPSNPQGAVRWWDGSAWTSHTQPVMAGGAPVAGSSMVGSLAGGPPPATFPPSAPAWSPGAPAAGYPYRPGATAYPARAPQASFAKQNRYTLIALAVVAVYILVAVSAHIVFIGIFPVIMSIRAVRAKEPLAPAAIVAAVIAVVVAIGFLS